MSGYLAHIHIHTTANTFQMNITIIYRRRRRWRDLDGACRSRRLPPLHQLAIRECGATQSLNKLHSYSWCVQWKLHTARCCAHLNSTVAVDDDGRRTQCRPMCNLPIRPHTVILCNTHFIYRQYIIQKCLCAHRTAPVMLSCA